MNPAALPETFVSVSLQAMLVVAVSRLLAGQLANERSQNRIWTVCCVLLIVLAVIAATCPSYRLPVPFGVGPTSVTASSVLMQQNFGRVLAVVWVTGMALALGGMLWRSVQMHRSLTGCRSVDLRSLPPLAELTDEPGAALCVAEQPVRIAAMADVTSPFCWQIHRPWIVVPEFLLRSHPDCVKYILRHELAHLRTGHPLQMFLQRTVELLFWFHPAVWRMSREIELVRESLCDRASVHSRSEISEYLRTLLTIAERQTGDSVSTSSPLGFLRGRSMMAERIRRLIQLAEQSGAPVRSWPAATTAASTLLIAAAASVALLRIPLSGPPSAELGWSCWPAWSAAVLHDLGMPVRDFERLGYQYTVQELREREQRGSPGTAAERLGMPRIRDP